MAIWCNGRKGGNPFPWYHTRFGSHHTFERKLPVISPIADFSRLWPPSPKVRKMSIKQFDPYQVFEVAHRPCSILEIRVVCGRNITKGWSDYVDTPDPYILLQIRTAPEGRRRTNTIDNETNPVWDESFTFLLDDEKDNKLSVSLMEANYLSDETLGNVSIPVNDLPRKTWHRQTLVFNDVSEVDIELRIYEDKEPTLRYSLCLCDEEKEFLIKRKQKVYEAMRSVLGERGPQTLKEVPNVAVIGSGGGFRAMVCFSGVVKALHDSGILQCCTYLSGLSGSSWYISTLYSHPDWPNMPPGDIQEELKNNIDSSLVWLLKPNSLYRYIDIIMQKRKKGQPVSFTDVFGLMVGETIIKDRLDTKLSDQQKKIDEGQVPMPLLTCVHVKKDRSARSFQEWVEFSPYEIGMAKYGTFMKTRLFGSKFFMGKLCTQYEEPPLHFLQGIWGSAFCILFKRLLEDNRKLDPVEMIRQEMAKQLDSNQLDESSDTSDEEDVEEGDEGEADLQKDTANKSDVKFSFDEENIKKTTGNNVPSFQRTRTVRRTKQKSYWHNFLQGIFESKNFELLSTRAGRAGVVHNFMRGLSLQQTFALSPFTPTVDPRQSDEFDGLFEMHPTDVKHLYMVDAGLTFNSPYPLVMRPQRKVDIIMSFDFSARPSDSSPAFKELLLAEKWAHRQRLPFPPIDITVFDREGMKELYIFKHPTDPHCPVVMHFVLVNIEFRTQRKPGVPRTTEEEKAFADFDVFDDPACPYSTFNFKYSHEAFERLYKLTEFNTLRNIDRIKDCFADIVAKKRIVPPKVPLTRAAISTLKRVSRKNKKRLELYITKVESGKFDTVDDQDVDAIGEESIDETDSAIAIRKTPVKRQLALKASSYRSRTPSPSGLTAPVDSMSLDTPEEENGLNLRSSPGRRRKQWLYRDSVASNATDVFYDARCNSIEEDDDDVYHSALVE